MAAGDTDGTRLWRTGEVARALGVSDRTVKNWDASGLLRPARLPSGARRYDPAAVLAFARRHGVPLPRRLRAWGELDDYPGWGWL